MMQIQFKAIKGAFLNFTYKFKGEESGGVQIMAAASILIAFASLSVVVDAGRMHQARHAMSAVSDNAALAAAKQANLTQEEREDIFESMINVNLVQNNLITDFDYELTFTETDDLIVLNVETYATTNLMVGLIGDSAQTVYAATEVTVGKENIEVSLVLDISSSMSGTRIIELQAAAKTFAQLLLEDEEKKDRVSISVIPYGGTVRLPDEFSGMHIAPSTNEHWTGQVWNNCVRQHHDDIGTQILPSDTFPFLPSFWVWWSSNPWCPHAGNEILGLTNDLDEINDKIDAFTLSDGTGTNVGAAWGYASLDPAWRGHFPNVDALSPRDFSESTKKIMIVMSDGGITPQYYPKDSQMDGYPIYFTKQKGETFNEAQANYVEICDLAKANGVEVYTVGFSTNTAQANRLKTCATNDTRHYESDLGGLTTVFVNLASSISSLRISG